MSDYDKSSQEPVRGPFPNAEAPAKLGRFNPKSRRSVGKLAGSLPGLAAKLAKDEIEHAKIELTAKAKFGGIGAGLFAVVAFFALTLWAVLITAAILGLNTVFAPWLSALIVAGVLLVIMIIAALVAISLFKKMKGVMPEETVASIKQDVNAVKGVGKYE
ncbi:phage holin family protein [Gulosibacter molinativorax]|uniref:Phage holin family protein n=1 Tax=Gulosibacter molinativorax TaxID=256821 RepID=A0ABT7C6A6_9MICO|nr:phage holin family protein [Gulosibacter molinativorax]MDJ1370715.1 phage holin family protein [Gulosibacter molinativorax]QUY63259.1 Conserved membrane protein [Gulosibacter molinativorax]